MSDINTFRRNHGYLDTVFRDVLPERADRRWLVAVLHDDDFRLRDGRAVITLLDRLKDRGDITRHFVRAYGTDPGASPPAGTDVLFVGRPKPFASSSLSRFARHLEGKSAGRWNDPADGTTGNSIQYGDVIFSRHELPTPPEHRQRRCDRDYGLLLFRGQFDAGDPLRRAVAVSGLSSFGTDCLMQVLCDDRLRAELLRQVRELASWQPEFRPEESFEICTQFQVDGEKQLADFLNRPLFHFRVVAVAVAGGKPFVRRPLDLELELIPAPDGGGYVRRDGSSGVAIAPLRYKLLRYLVDNPGRRKISELAKYIYGAASEEECKRLVKLLFDTNQSLRRIPGLEHSHPIGSHKKRRTQPDSEGAYVLRGSWSVREPRIPAPDSGARSDPEGPTDPDGPR